MDHDDPIRSRLLTETYSGFAPLAARLSALDARLVEFSASGNGAIAAKAKQLLRKIRDFEPTVTIIGQVKAGKTTLINAMTGWQGLLPADVNPWTSVVTGLHLQPGPERQTANATFTFFGEEEWTRLVRQGGRLGELAGRAGAEDEVAKVRAQMEKMRAKSRERLGRRFEMLLGQSHDYDRFDAALVERYVCMGDDFWEEAGGDREKGRFADITRTADLWLKQPGLPLPLCLRDTPGVNDTFMIREQITISSLRGSRLCVMVLAATQALTTVDLALIRMIANLRARDVVIFVNRIDELDDPASDIPKIRDSILDTLRKHQGPENAEIIFGSGAWAAEAMAGQVEALPEDSVDAMVRWAEAGVGEEHAFGSLEDMAWTLSGVPALGRIIAARIESGAGAQLLREIEVEIGNLDRSVLTADAVAAARRGAGSVCRIPPEALEEAISEIEERARRRFADGLGPLHAALEERVDGARQVFVRRALVALVSHLELHGEMAVWRYDSCGLRALLRSAFQRYVRAVGRHGTDGMAAVSAEFNALYREAFDLRDAPPMLEAPPLPAPDAPVVLGQTIALDLRGTWWTRFWRRRKGYQACADDFERLIHEETQPILQTLLSDNAKGYEASLRAALGDFLDANRRVLLDLARAGASNASENLAQTMEIAS
ncbi:dynamin family protein [Jannaschia seohaensis]|uniref:Dynamin family protein n=1 Tax=Jannaschia seohaensis TaxID=475081 RepID=A0A2Y9C0D7_9RHOB|nr:dynamin family protein [Jannaschia seohaensis]PWJ19340.1 dynamin family protein [Jannaschia seohaensis]SSA46002.1 Dynamin family protein [Jannaschia seohaensis]